MILNLPRPWQLLKKECAGIETPFASLPSEMKEPRWLSKGELLAVHERLLAEHGGLAGIRDAGLLSSAMGRPKNILAYEKSSLFDLAAAYAHGIAKNHAFNDGNKRTALMAPYIFLGKNGYQ
jgi:death-on-curing protein